MVTFQIGFFLGNYNLNMTSSSDLAVMGAIGGKEACGDWEV